MIGLSQRKLLEGWGRFPVATCEVTEPASATEALAALHDFPSIIPRGNGRSYGDASLNPDGVVASRRLSHMLAFDEATGVLVCEAGVMLSDLIEVMLPRGWFAPVTPGTRFVTLGGMIASDVHGKNHHLAGSMADHVLWIDLALPDGRVVRCAPDQEAELFAATCGGMGLTGMMVRAAIQLMRVETAQIRSRTRHAAHLDEAFAIFEAEQSATYTVAWVDVFARGARLGRSVVFAGDHARIEDLPSAQRADPLARKADRVLRLPIDLPPLAMSRPAVTAFNTLYGLAQRSGEAVGDLYPYFYPLDAVLEWNRIYGRRGFVQHQCVLPLEESREGMRRLLLELSERADPSFLNVLKRMGPGSFGHLSFPMEGYTLAVDLPATPRNLAVLDRLDAIVAEHRGRLYLTKDGRAKPSAMAGYPRLDAFREVRRRFGLDGAVESLLSRRLEI